jgi:hypothetical protein
LNTDRCLDELKSLLGHSDAVETIDIQDFDGQGLYGEVIKAVEESAAAKDVKIYRVTHGRTRAEYYLVAVDSKQGKLVGMKANAVET